MNAPTAMAERPLPRALLLSPTMPSDRGNGLAMRAGLLLSGLAQAFEVDVVIPADAPTDSASAAFTTAACHRCHTLPSAPSGRAADHLALLATPEARERCAALRPLPELCRGAPPAGAAHVAQLATDAELVVVFRLYLAPLVDAILDRPDRPALMIDVDELDADVEAAQSRPHEAERLLRLERYYLPRFDHVVACAVRDARLLRERTGAAAVTAIPNAVTMPRSTMPPTGEIDLVFVGNLSYAPNVEGARWLCEAVLPLLGDVTIAVVGSQPAAAVCGLGSDPRVTVVADPADVAPWYAAARIAVVPLLHGGGSRLKLIEALAHGRPVVSTTVGAEGQPWGLSAGAGVVIADDAGSFAAACRDLLGDPQRALIVGESGRAAVTAHADAAIVAPRVAQVAREAVGRRAASEPGGPLITAALIVRDEEAFLGPCLDSLAGVADEIVVVDTGSTDATVSIALAHGAHVLHHPWGDDFSTPRNVGLDHAHGDWILYIDADERLMPVDRHVLEQRLTRSPAAAMRILLAPKLHANPYFEYRLWRNDPRIRFRGAMHEQVVDAIHAAAEQDGRPIEDCGELQLLHIGYEGDQTRKHARNLPLLQAQLQRDPGNIYNWRHLARVLEGLDRPAEADAALMHATELALSEPTPTVDGGLAWGELLARRHGQGHDVGALLSLGRERWPQHWMICWIEGIIAQEQGRLDEAERCFRALLAVDVSTLPQTGIAYDTRIFGEWAHASLGLVLFRAGRAAEAADAYAAAERCAPQEREYTIKRQLAQARAG